MSSFYKSNLMDNYDSPLIPPEKDLQKEEEIDKNESNVEESKVTENEKSPSENVDFPYKRIIARSQYLIFVGLALLCIYLGYNAHFLDTCNENNNEQILPKTFLDPSNSTNEAINITYEEDPVEICEETIFQKQYKIHANAAHAYILAATILLLNSFYYISKARKCELSPEQKEVCDIEFDSSLFLVFGHIVVVTSLTVMSYLLPCSTVNYLVKVPYNIFFPLLCGFISLFFVTCVT